MALRRQLLELRVALGWKERFASSLAFFLLDVGIGKPKQVPPAAITKARIGRHNDQIDLPRLPVRSRHSPGSVAHSPAGWHLLMALRVCL